MYKYILSVLLVGFWGCEDTKISESDPINPLVGNWDLASIFVTVYSTPSLFNPSAQTISLGGSILFTGGSGINTTISVNEITFATDGSIVTESSTDTLTNKTISESLMSYLSTYFYSRIDRFVPTGSILEKFSF